ncbi:MAG TPA: hypothetical protein VGS12_10530 [Caulobacteraceae bacterium]|nr:hypothetical protein [Caulobacteraceae bacterium]
MSNPASADRHIHKGRGLSLWPVLKKGLIIPMQQLTTIAGALALALAFAAPAFAEGRLAATLEAPQASASQFVSAHAVWNCAGTDCSTGYAPDDGAGLSGCEELVKHVGRVTAFGGDHRQLDAKALAKCNAVAKGPAATATASR